MKSHLLYPSLFAFLFCQSVHFSYAMDIEPETFSSTQRLKNEQAVRAFFSLDITPKVALYGEGDAHTREQTYQGFLTVASDPAACPKVLANITNLEEMSVIPAGQLDRVELRNIPSAAFSKNPKAIFQDIHRVLKMGGTVKFNDMWGGCEASAIKSKILTSFQENSQEFKAVSSIPAKHLCLTLIKRGQLNPFHQYLDAEDQKEMEGKRMDEKPVWRAYQEQLTNFFQSVGFTDLTRDNLGFWSARKAS